MKYRKKMICLAAGLMVMTVLAGCGKSEVVMDAQQETAVSGSAETNANAGSGADASGQAGQSAGKDTVAGAGENVQAAGVNASAPVSGGTSSGSTVAAGVANGVSTAGKTGWVEEKDGWHLYDAQGTSMTGWVENEGSRYYFDRDGRMLTDWQEVGGSWYYLGADGRMLTDWQQVKGSWFYLGGDGAMRTGWQDIDGKRYYFEDSGAMLHDTTVGDYVLFSDGSAGKRLRNFEGEYKKDWGHYEQSYQSGHGLSFNMKDLGNGMLELSGGTFGALIPQSGDVILPAVDGITGVLHMEGDRGSWDENGNVIGQHVEDDISVRLVQEGDIVRLEMDDSICYPLDYLLQKYKVSFIGFPDKYIGYSLSDMEAIFGSANSEGSAFQNLMFGDGDTEYYAFNGTDIVYAFTGYSVDQRVFGACSNNPHNFFRYEGVLTLDAIIGQVAEGEEPLDIYAIYAPELANTYSSCRISINGQHLDIDYRIEDDAVTAVYWHGW